MHSALLKRVFHAYGLDFSRIRPDLPLGGSPQRSLERAAAEDLHGKLYLVEALPPGTRDRKESIAETLDKLSGAGLRGLSCYLPLGREKHILSLEAVHYQISPYVRGVELPRPEYLDHAWRGRAMADFLSRLRRAARTAGIPGESPPVFSLKAFLRNLIGALEKRDPEILERASPALRATEPFLTILENLPAGFCHGDFHPVNVLWGEDRLNAVIDWEFCGAKPEMYDAALMTGCAGFEHPPGLGGDYVGAFLAGLRRGGLFAEESWDNFFPLVLLIRFAWLSEWLRSAEAAMIALELDYLDFLTSHARDLAVLFASVRPG